MSWHLIAEISEGVLLLGVSGFAAILWMYSKETTEELDTAKANVRALTDARDRLQIQLYRREHDGGHGWEEAARWEARYRRQVQLCQQEHIDRPLAVNPLTADKIRELEAQLGEMF